VSKCGVLLVNCVPDEREMYAIFLQASGYTPVEVCDAHDALTQAVRTRAEVVVIDLMLPGGGDALGLIEELRADERTRHAVIIVLTARAFERDRAAAAQAGCDIFLAKPCSPAVLLGHVVNGCAREERAAQPLNA
jgi:DNA-binding response OmpR family regulator